MVVLFEFVFVNVVLYLVCFIVLINVWEDELFIINIECLVKFILVLVIFEICFKVVLILVI